MFDSFLDSKLATLQVSPLCWSSLVFSFRTCDDFVFMAWGRMGAAPKTICASCPAQVQETMKVAQTDNNIMLYLGSSSLAARLRFEPKQIAMFSRFHQWTNW